MNPRPAAGELDNNAARGGPVAPHIHTWDGGMIFIWGKKYSFKQLGYAADFCPICRGPSAFRLRRRSLVPHVYYIPSGAGTVLGDERQCLQCRVEFNTDLARYDVLAKKRGSCEQLLAETFSGFAMVERNRLDIEKRIRRDPHEFSPADRQTLLRQPFELLANKVEADTRNLRVDAGVGLGFAAAIALLMIGVPLATRFAPDDTDMVTLTLLAIGVVIVVAQFALTSKRYVRREIGPLLVRSLAPLKPTEAELAAVVTPLRQQRVKIAKKLDLPDLMRKLEAAPVAGA